MTSLPSRSDGSSSPIQTTFYIEWGGSADLSVRDIWPDGDAPANPTTADVMEAMVRSARGGGPGYLCREWNLDIEEVSVSGNGGSRSLTDRGVYVRGEKIADEDDFTAIKRSER